MSRLYNGFDALKLGQAINKTHNDIAKQRMTGIDALGGAIQEMVKEQAEENEKQRQKQSALDFLMGHDVSESDANALVNSGIAPGELTRYMQGRLDKASDIADERDYHEQQNLGRREELIADRAYEKQNAIDKEGRDNRKSGILTKYRGLVELRNSLAMKMQSGSFPSVRDLQRQAQIDKQIADLEASYPEFFGGAPSGTSPSSGIQNGMDVLDSDLQGAPLQGEPQLTEADDDYYNSDAAPMTIERTKRRILELFENGSVDPARLASLDEEFVKNHGVSIYNIPEVKDLVELAQIYQSGNKTDRKAVNTKTGGVHTRNDDEDSRNKTIEQRRLDESIRLYQEWVKSPKGTRKPNIAQKYVNQWPKKYRDVWARH